MDGTSVVHVTVTKSVAHGGHWYEPGQHFPMTRDELAALPADAGAEISRDEDALARAEGTTTE